MGFYKVYIHTIFVHDSFFSSSSSCDADRYPGDFCGAMVFAYIVFSRL